MDEQLLRTVLGEVVEDKLDQKLKEQTKEIYVAVDCPRVVNRVSGSPHEHYFSMFLGTIKPLMDIKSLSGLSCFIFSVENSLSK
jgi:hypothetical protein